MKAYTALKGKSLVEFSKQFTNCEKVCILPEGFLSPAELQSFVKDYSDMYDVVLTFSAFILTDVNSVTVIDSNTSSPTIKRGDSVNRINMQLWTKYTIGEKVRDEFKEIEETVNNNTVTADDAIDALYSMYGDSVERVLLINQLMGK